MQKICNVIASIVILAFVSACEQKAGERSRVWDKTEEAAVYSVLIERELAIPLSFYNLDDTLLIVNTTYETTYYENVSDEVLYNDAPSLDKDTLKDFRAVNRDYQTLDLPLSISKPYAYVAEPMSYEDWRAIRQNYPDALVYVMFSRVGFNQGQDQALVYMAHRCGSECGIGAIYFLVRKEGVWHVENEINAWVS